ncbi:syntaxin-12-like isoform X1 [Arapaima gigas]
MLPVPSQRQHKIQREHLLKDFMAALEDLHSVQQRVTQWRVVSAAMGQVTSNPSVDQGVHDNLLVISESQESWGQTDKSEAKYLTQEDLEMLKDRQASLHQLESDMIDMNEIFKDLSVMIQDQGDTLDGIQENMQRTEQRVEQGVEQLFQATNHQQRSRKKMCILALVMSLMTSLMMVAVSTGRQTSARYPDGQASESHSQRISQGDI